MLLVGELRLDLLAAPGRKLSGLLPGLPGQLLPLLLGLFFCCAWISLHGFSPSDGFLPLTDRRALSLPRTPGTDQEHLEKEQDEVREHGQAHAQDHADQHPEQAPSGNAYHLNPPFLLGLPSLLPTAPKDGRGQGLQDPGPFRAPELLRSLTRPRPWGCGSRPSPDRG